MEAMEKVKLLQVIYAGALADSVLRYGREGLLEKVTAEKRAEQLAQGAMRAKQLGITSPDDVFAKLVDIAGCSDWTIEANADGKGFSAAATRCMLCAMAKKLGAESPCSIYCLDPMEGMVKGLDSCVEFNVNSTLWEGKTCSVSVK
jgi:hypothetical protein